MRAHLPNNRGKLLQFYQLMYGFPIPVHSQGCQRGDCWQPQAAAERHEGDRGGGGEKGERREEEEEGQMHWHHH